MIKKIFISFLTFIICLVPVFALNIPQQDKSIYVNDYADVLSDSTKKTLVSLNRDSDYSTGGYVVIATFDFVEGDLYDYAYQMFNEWGVGDSHHNNGILLVLDIGHENYSWIIGTGLEKVLTDGRCQTIIDDYLEKDFANKNYDRAVLNTTKQFLKYIDSGNFAVTDNQKTELFGVDIMGIIKAIVMILILAVIILASRSSSRRRGYTTRRRYRRPPSSHMGRPRMGPGSRRSFGPGPSIRPTSRFSGGSMRSQPRTGGGSHHSGGSSRGAGGTRK